FELPRRWTRACLVSSSAVGQGAGGAPKPHSAARPRSTARVDIATPPPIEAREEEAAEIGQADPGPRHGWSAGNEGDDGAAGEAPDTVPALFHVQLRGSTIGAKEQKRLIVI